MQFSTKRGFTVVEIVIVSVILAVGFVSILGSMNRGLNFTQKTREKVIAINLVREGMEITYQIRDTNLRRWSGKRDQCRLKIDPLDSSMGNPDTCADDDWMKKGFYNLTTKSNNGQKYNYLNNSLNTSGLDLEDGLDSSDLHYSLCNQSGVWAACPGIEPVSQEGRYFRQLEGKGLYRKDISTNGGEEIICNNGNDVDGGGDDCGDDRAKEYRFCNKVAYIGFGQGAVELCGVITNFYD